MGTLASTEAERRSGAPGLTHRLTHACKLVFVLGILDYILVS